RAGALPRATARAHGPRGPGSVGDGAARRRQSASEDGQRDRHAPRGLLLLGRGGPGATALRRGGGARPRRAAAPQRGESGNLRAGSGPPGPPLIAQGSRFRSGGQWGYTSAPGGDTMMQLKEIGHVLLRVLDLE